MRNRQKIFWWENETWKFQKLDSLTQKNRVSFFHLIFSQEQRPFSVESQQQQYGRAREDVYHGNPILWALWTQGDQVLQAIDDYCRTQWLWQDDHHRVLEGGLLWRISSSHPSRKVFFLFFFIISCRRTLFMTPKCQIKRRSRVRSNSNSKERTERLMWSLVLPNCKPYWSRAIRVILVEQQVQVHLFESDLKDHR